MGSSPSHVPTELQGHLLRAALLQGPPAQEAWKLWRDRAHLETLDPESSRLLPLAYRNLGDSLRGDPWLPRMRGTARHTLCRNLSLFTVMAKVLRALQQADIPTMLLKGAALVIVHHRDAALRPMADLDVLVPTVEAERAVAILQQSGFRPILYEGRSRVTPNFIRLTHAVGMAGPHGREFDLHWHMLADDCVPTADDDFWTASVPTVFQGIQTRAPAPTDLLFHCLIHASSARRETNIRWIADAATLLKGGCIDWDRLVVQARKHHLTLFLRDMLQVLRESGTVEVPVSTLAALQAAQVSWMDRLRHGHQMRLAPLTLSRLVGRLWFYHVRSFADRRVWSLILSFPAFLRTYYESETFWSLAGRAATRGLRRVRTHGF